MKTEAPVLGRLSKKDELTLISQRESVESGYAYIPNNNRTKHTNRMDNLTMDPKEDLNIFRKRYSRKSLYSHKGVKVLLILGFLLFSIGMFAQNLGDYGTIADGDWDNSATWGVWNGTSFVNNGTYPGQTGGSYDVYIVDGNSVTLDTDIPGAFNSLIIGDDSGGDTETLFIDGTSSLNTRLLIIESDGAIDWTANKTFSFPEDTTIIIEPGGDLVEDIPCDAAQRIELGSLLILSLIHI